MSTKSKEHDLTTLEGVLMSVNYHVSHSTCERIALAMRLLDLTEKYAAMGDTALADFSRWFLAAAEKGSK